MAQQELPKAATPGTVVGGKYRIDKVLGRGGMGVVLSATHLELGKRVAVKMLIERASPAAAERFRREAQVAAQISSPHVAQVLDSGTHDGMPFLVMELLEGNDLEHEIRRRGRLPAYEAVDLLLEACVGVAHAHATGLVHRDLKPANLFLARARSGKRTTKVLDFGLIKGMAGDTQSLTASADVFGTPQYMAPEQIQSSKNVDARCDQHALGLVLFELLAGRPVYMAESVPQLIVVIATVPPPSLESLIPDAPPGLDQVLRVAIAKLPDHRYPDLGAFAAALVRYGTPRAAELATEVAAILREGGRSERPAIAAWTPEVGAPVINPWDQPAAAGTQRAATGAEGPATVSASAIASAIQPAPAASPKRTVLLFSIVAVLAGIAVGLGGYVMSRRSTEAPASSASADAPDAAASAAASAVAADPPPSDSATPEASAAPLASSEAPPDASATAASASAPASASAALAPPATPATTSAPPPKPPPKPPAKPAKPAKPPASAPDKPAKPPASAPPKPPASAPPKPPASAPPKPPTKPGGKCTGLDCY